MTPVARAGVRAHPAGTLMFCFVLFFLLCLTLSHVLMYLRRDRESSPCTAKKRDASVFARTDECRGDIDVYNMVIMKHCLNRGFSMETVAAIHLSLSVSH